MRAFIWYNNRGLDKIDSFIAQIEGKAQELETCLISKKVVKSEDDVQNLTRKDFKSMDSESQAIGDELMQITESSFPAFQQVIEQTSQQLPLTFKYLEAPFNIILFARVPCPGCCDSMYRYALLMKKLLMILKKNPFMSELPTEIAETFQGLWDKANSSLIKKRYTPRTTNDNGEDKKNTYLPHGINFQSALNTIDASVTKFSENEGKHLINDADIRTLRDLGDAIAQGNVDWKTQFLAFDGKMRELKSTEKNDVNKIQSIVNATLSDYPSMIMTLLLLHIAHSEVDAVAHRTDAFKSRLSMFQSQEETPQNEPEISKSYVDNIAGNVTFTDPETKEEITVNIIPMPKDGNCGFHALHISVKTLKASTPSRNAIIGRLETAVNNGIQEVIESMAEEIAARMQLNELGDIIKNLNLSMRTQVMNYLKADDSAGLRKFITTNIGIILNYLQWMRGGTTEPNRWLQYNGGRGIPTAIAHLNRRNLFIVTLQEGEAPAVYKYSYTGGNPQGNQYLILTKEGNHFDRGDI